MSDDFPRSVDAISNAWLSEVLGAPVSGFKTTYLEDGVLSDAYKLHDIAYAAQPPARRIPSSSSSPSGNRNGATQRSIPTPT